MSTKNERRISEALRRATVWVEAVDVRRVEQGWSARLVLSPGGDSARAEQQGLKDGSLRAELAQDSVIQMLDAYITKVNEQLPASCQIVSREFDLTLEGGPTNAEAVSGT